MTYTPLSTSLSPIPASDLPPATCIPVLMGPVPVKDLQGNMRLSSSVCHVINSTDSCLLLVRQQCLTPLYPVCSSTLMIAQDPHFPLYLVSFNSFKNTPPTHTPWFSHFPLGLCLNVEASPINQVPHSLPMDFPSDSTGTESTCNARDTGDLGFTPGSGRFPGGGNGNPLHYSCLENPMDRGPVGWI